MHAVDGHAGGLKVLAPDTSVHYESPAPNFSGNTLTWNALIPAGIILTNTAVKPLNTTSFQKTTSNFTQKSVIHFT